MLATPWRRAVQRYLMWWERLWLRLFNRSVGGAIGKTPVLVVHTVGRKTGKVRTVPLGYLRDGDDFLVGGGSGGSLRHPGWSYNLQAQPDVDVLIDRRRIPVTAQPLQGEARAEAWKRIMRAYPVAQKYDDMLDREIPVFRLTRRR